jgi:hypothetical protein
MIHNFGVNTDIFETNVLNLLVVISIVVTIVGDAFTQTLKDRQKRISDRLSNMDINQAIAIRRATERRDIADRLKTVYEQAKTCYYEYHLPTTGEGQTRSKSIPDFNALYEEMPDYERVITSGGSSRLLEQAKSLNQIGDWIRRKGIHAPESTNAQWADEIQTLCRSHVLSIKQLDYVRERSLLTRIIVDYAKPRAQQKRTSYFKQNQHHRRVPIIPKLSSYIPLYYR